MYQLLGIDEQIDLGYGVTGEAYYNSAEVLRDEKNKIKVQQLKELPINFLYRHSIELFLKSLIIICHKKLKVPYGDEPSDSNKPKILTDGVWRPLHRSHWIDVLYSYWREFVDNHYDKLTDMSGPNSHWNKENDIEVLIDLIAKYDKESSFFRYPVTENEEGDIEKFEMQKVDIDSLQSIFKKEVDLGEITTVFLDENEQVTKAYTNKGEPLEDLTNALQKVSYYLYCIHIMARMTICKGN